MADARLILTGHNIQPSRQGVSSHTSPESGESPEGTGASLNLQKGVEISRAAAGLLFVLKKQYIPPCFPLISGFSPLLEDSAPPLLMKYQVQGCQMTYMCLEKSRTKPNTTGTN